MLAIGIGGFLFVGLLVAIAPKQTQRDRSSAGLVGEEAKMVLLRSPVGNGNVFIARDAGDAKRKAKNWIAQHRGKRNLPEADRLNRLLGSGDLELVPSGTLAERRGRTWGATKVRFPDYSLPSGDWWVSNSFVDSNRSTIVRAFGNREEKQRRTPEEEAKLRREIQQKEAKLLAEQAELKNKKAAALLAEMRTARESGQIETARLLADRFAKDFADSSLAAAAGEERRRIESEAKTQVEERRKERREKPNTLLTEAERMVASGDMKGARLKLRESDHFGTKSWFPDRYEAVVEAIAVGAKHGAPDKQRALDARGHQSDRAAQQSSDARSNEKAKSAFARAEILRRAGKIEASAKLLIEIIDEFPDGEEASKARAILGIAQ